MTGVRTDFHSNSSRLLCVVWESRALYISHTICSEFMLKHKARAQSHTSVIHILAVGGLRWGLQEDGMSHYTREILENLMLTVQQSVKCSEILPKKQIAGMPVIV